MTNMPKTVFHSSESAAWFIGHVRSLAMSPKECCEDQGSYLVATELFHFLQEPLPVLDELAMSDDQRDALKRLRACVGRVPPEARNSDTSAAASLADMSHAAWDAPRRAARDLLLALGQ
ncbi:hypothetical protein [Rhodoferax koreensis]|uniref:hypothetical protein n=1 Tax=Rhodoferax koreensis TaxID=1842727 RepID=UPI0012FFAE4D|nr:hypothetical protein [Rhodoferax koreense]